jgi:hypothetical protein
MYPSKLIDGTLYIHFSQSLQKKFIFKGNQLEICPFRIKREVIDHDYDSPSEKMINGIFFESISIGGGSKGNGIYDLPRLKTGKKSIDQLRIESQSIEFKHDIRNKNIDINNYSTQRTYFKVWRGLEKFNVIVIFTGDVDIISSLIYKNEYIPMAVIDLKLASDLSCTWGDFSWGNPESMDHTQAYAYNWITGLYFFYMLYDYKPEMRKNIFRVVTNKLIIHEFLESLRKSVIEYIKIEKEGWKKNPSTACAKCKVKECEYCGLTEQEI